MYGQAFPTGQAFPIFALSSFRTLTKLCSRRRHPDRGVHVLQDSVFSNFQKKVLWPVSVDQSALCVAPVRRPRHRPRADRLCGGPLDRLFSLILGYCRPCVSWMFHATMVVSVENAYLPSPNVCVVFLQTCNMSCFSVGSSARFTASLSSLTTLDSCWN